MGPSSEKDRAYAKARRFFQSERGQIVWFKSFGRVLGEMSPGKSPTKTMRDAAIEFLYSAKSKYTGERAEHSYEKIGKLWEDRALKIISDELSEIGVKDFFQ